jgi:hypothetical protein
MERVRGASFLIVLVLPLSIGPTLAPRAYSQASAQPSDQIKPLTLPAAKSGTKSRMTSGAPPVGADAPHMSKQTRYEIIRDFETQIFYARTAFPMGTKGLTLKDGSTTPGGIELQQALALWGPAIKPGDPAQISYVQIKPDHIHFDINGGALHRKKWYEHIEVSGTGGAEAPIAGNQSPQNPHGTYLDLYFPKYVPEMSAQQLRDLLLPVLDFNARNKEEAYLDTVPPKVKEAIEAHYVLVGMSTEMVLHAKGKPPKKVREKDGETDYEEWIYGEPPQDVDFVRIVDDEVIRVETMKSGGQKVVRTDKEIILNRPDRDTEAKKEQERQPNAPTMRRPGEDEDNVPKPANGASPMPPLPPPDLPQPPGSPGPGQMVASR